MRRSQQSALQARDDGLRRVRKITWRIALFAAAAAAFVGARFAHLSPSQAHLQQLPSSLTGGSSANTGNTGQSSSSGISSSSGVSSGTGGGQAVSGGS